MPPRRSRPAKASGDPFARLKEQGPGPAYLIEGVYVLVEDFVRALRNRVFPPGSPAVDFNLETFVGERASVDEVLGAAETLPAFAPRRLVLVFQAEGLLKTRKGGEADIDRLVAYLERPATTATLALVASERWDRRSKLYKAFEKHGELARFEEPKEGEITRILGDRAKALGADIEPEAARAIVGCVGADLSAALAALERLILFVGPGSATPIRKDDVEVVLALVREENVFELVEAIAAGDAARAARGIARIFGDRREQPEGTALRLLALMARQYRHLVKAKAAADLRIPSSQLPSVLGVPPFVADKVRQQASSGDIARFARGLASIATTDRSVKGGSLRAEAAVERLATALRNDERLDPPESR